MVLDMSKEEFNLIKAALAHYRLAGFPMGKSSYDVPISFRDRREWAAFGMKVWDKIYNLKS